VGHGLSCSSCFWALIACSALALCGCGQNKEQQTEAWESQKRSAFQEFRDRRYDAAIVSYEKALETARRIDGDGVEVASTYNEMAAVYMTAGKEKEAGEFYEMANELLERLANADNLNHDIMRAYADTCEGLGKLKEKNGDLSGSAQLYSKGIDVARRANVPTKLRELVYEYKSVLQQQGKDKEAKALEQTFPNLGDNAKLPDKESYLREETRKYLSAGELAMKEGHFAEADKAYQDAYGYARQSTDGKFRGGVAGTIALFLYGTHNLQPAENAIAAAIRDWRDAGVEDKQMHSYLVTYSAIEHELGKDEGSKRAAELSMKIAKKDFGDDSVQMQQSLSALVNAYVGQHRYDDAIPLFERSYELTKKRSALGSPEVIMHTCWLANIYWLGEKPDKARSLVDSYCNAVLKAKANRLLVGRLLADYGDVTQRTAQREEAALFYNSAVRVLKDAPENTLEMKRARGGLLALQTRYPTHHK
jgi:tetratricopeptide (TPR) repeat protein